MSRSDAAFVRPILSLLTGTALANLIAALGTPILTRLYSPEDFGVFAIYTGIVAVAAVLVGWRYDVGIVLPKEERQATLLLTVSLLLAFFSSVALGILLLIVREPLSRATDAPALSTWILLAPLHVFIAAAYAAFSYWATRTGNFRQIALTRIVQSTGSLITRIGVAVVQTASFVGLTLGQFIADSAATLLIARNALPALTRQNHRPTLDELREIAFEHRSLAVHAISTTFLNSMATFLLPFLIAYYFGAFSAGLVMLAHRVISMPFIMVTTSLWQVAHAQLPQHSESERQALFFRIHRAVSLLFAFPLTFLAFFPGIVVLVFGPDWTAVAGIVPAIAAMVYFSSIANSTNYFVAFGLYRWDSLSNIVLFAVRLGSIIAGAAWTDFNGTVLLYSLSSAAVYFLTTVVWAAYFGRIAEYVAFLVGAPVIAAALFMPVVYYVGPK